MNTLKLKATTLSNYKKFSNELITFGDKTIIEGKNGQGKSTIASILPYVLFNTDEFGNKIDITPLGSSETSFSDLFVEIDGEETKLHRRSLNGVNKNIEINEVPYKVKEFESWISEQDVNKDVFLSIYNPTYFFGLHWKKQRDLIFSKVDEPLMKEVYEFESTDTGKPMKEKHIDLIEKQFKKFGNLNDAYLSAVNKHKKNEKEMDVVRGRISVFNELTSTCIKKEEKDEIDSKIQELEAYLNKVKELEDKRISLNNKINTKMTDVRLAKKDFDDMVSKVRMLLEHEDTCKVCGNSLNEEQQTAKKEHIKMEKMKGKETQRVFKEQQAALKELQDKLGGIMTEQATYNRVGVQEEIHDLKKKLSDYHTFQTGVEDEKAKLAVMKNEIMICMDAEEAIEIYNKKRNELFELKVNELFEGIYVEVFETQKNGELKETFNVKYMDKSYNLLSTGELIRCGIELSNALCSLYNVNYPIFIDNAESVSGDVEIDRQCILAYVTDGELEIKAN